MPAALRATWARGGVLPHAGSGYVFLCKLISGAVSYLEYVSREVEGIRIPVLAGYSNIVSLELAGPVSDPFRTKPTGNSSIVPFFEQNSRIHQIEQCNRLLN